ncbi:hypothetical protein O9X98_05950 [Agrobacterium salinitolerans]|nr:hypothetical protein [Agrobacterium salinitolerans]
MKTETQLRAAMTEAGVDFLNTTRTLWADIQSHEDGYASMAVLERFTDDPYDPAFRISRAFGSGGNAYLKTDGELSGVGLAEIDDQFGESVESGMRAAIENKLGSPLTLVWATINGSVMSFIGRAGGQDNLVRLVCGQYKRKPSGDIVEIGLDRPISEVLAVG